MIVVVTDVAAASSVARTGSDSETTKGSLTSSVVSCVAWTVNVLLPPFGTVSVSGCGDRVVGGTRWPARSRVELDRGVGVRAVGQADRVRRRRALVDRRRPVIDNFCASSAPACPGSAIRHAKRSPAAPSRRTFARVISSLPQARRLGVPRLRFEKKVGAKTYPGGEASLMPSGVAADTATRRQLLFPPLVDPKERKAPATPGPFVWQSPLARTNKLR